MNLLRKWQRARQARREKREWLADRLHELGDSYHARQMVMGHLDFETAEYMIAKLEESAARSPDGKPTIRFSPYSRT